MNLQAQIPDKLEGITAEWLSEALASNFPGTDVTSVYPGTIIHGTATKVRLLLTYNEAGNRHGLPPTMWLKGGYEPHSDTQIPIYAGETCFYRDLAAVLDIGCPAAYFAYTDPKTRHSVLLLEDLLARNATFGRATEPVTPAQVAAILSLQAKLHGRFWTGEGLEKYPWLGGGGALNTSGVIAMIFEADNWNRCIALPRGRLVPKALQDRERTRHVMLHMLEQDRLNAHCLVHGDAHLGNVFFTPGGQAGYVDWQTTMRGYWAHDVADFMTTSMTVSDRRQSEKDLIEHYIRELKVAGGPEVAFAAAWLDYRKHAMYNFGWSMCLPEWQPEDVCSANTERACAAVLDLDTLGAWNA